MLLEKENYDPGKYIRFQDDEKIKVTKQNYKKKGKVITLYVSFEQFENIGKIKKAEAIKKVTG